MKNLPLIADVSFLYDQYGYGYGYVAIDVRERKEKMVNRIKF